MRHHMKYGFAELPQAQVRFLVENSTLFVSELDSRVTNEMLKDAFQQFGAVKRAEVSLIFCLFYFYFRWGCHAVLSEMLKDAFKQFGAVKRAEFCFFISAQRWDEKRTGTNVQILTCFT